MVLFNNHLEGSNNFGRGLILLGLVRAISRRSNVPHAVNESMVIVCKFVAILKPLYLYYQTLRYSLSSPKPFPSHARHFMYPKSVTPLKLFNTKFLTLRQVFFLFWSKVCLLVDLKAAWWLLCSVWTLLFTYSDGLTVV